MENVIHNRNQNIDLLSRRRMPTDLEIKTKKINNILSTYEWDEELERKPGFWLSIILEDIDVYPELFAVTDKLKHMLLELLPNLDPNVYVALLLNNDLINLCNDIGLIDDKFKLNEIAYIHLRKGLGQDCTVPMLFNYIKSVMITI